jgi:hypothetical protein
MASEGTTLRKLPEGMECSLIKYIRSDKRDLTVRMAITSTVMLPYPDKNDDFQKLVQSSCIPSSDDWRSATAQEVADYKNAEDEDEDDE